MGHDHRGPVPLDERVPRRRHAPGKRAMRLTIGPVDRQGPVGQRAQQVPVRASRARRTCVPQRPRRRPRASGRRPRRRRGRQPRRSPRRSRSTGAMGSRRRASPTRAIGPSVGAEPRGLCPPDLGQRRIAPPAVADCPTMRSLHDGRGRSRSRQGVTRSTGPETPADPKVAMPSRSVTAASMSWIASAAPVPSPSRRSSSRSGRRPSRSRTIAWPGSLPRWPAISRGAARRCESRRRGARPRP